MSAALDLGHPTPTARPLPTLRVLPVPDRDPLPTAGPPRLQAAPQRSHGHQLRLVVTDPVPTRQSWADPVPTASDQLPDVGDAAHRLAQAVIDVLAGHRPVQQLLRWTRPDVFDALRRRAAVASLPAQACLAGPTVRRAVVRSVRVCQVGGDAVEASAVVVDGGRARAVAMRLEGLDGRWRLSALVIG